MNCQDIGRILDSGKFSALSASERRDGEAHARSCRHCAPRWAVHARLADMPIPAMPAELAARCQTLVAAGPRSNVLRFVPRIVVTFGGFVVLTAAAAVITVKYIAPALDRAAMPEPRRDSVVAMVPVQDVSPPPVPAPTPPPPIVPATQPDKPVQPVAQGGSNVNKPAGIAAALVAAMNAGATPQSLAAIASNGNSQDKNCVQSTVVSRGSVLVSRTCGPSGPPYEVSLTGSDIPPVKVTMIFYNSVAHAESADDPGLRLFRAATHLSPEVIAPYMEYVRAAVAAAGRYEGDQRSQLLCDKRDAITTADQLAATLVQIDANIESNQARYIADSERILGAGNKRLVDDYVLGTRNGLVVRVRDMPKYVKWAIEDQRMSVSDIAAKLCGG